MPFTVVTLVIAALSMVGIPPTGGFFSKWYLVLGALAVSYTHLMQECNVVVDCYAVYFQEKTAAEVKISNSKLQGWAAYYAYSCNTDAVIENSTLTGVNCFEYVEGQYNDFSTIVLDGGELWGKEPETGGYGNDILVKNSTIKAETLKGRVQDIVSCNYNASANKIEFAGCTFETAGKLADALGGEALPALYYSSDASNKIIVDKLSMDTSSEYDLELDPCLLYTSRCV